MPYVAELINRIRVFIYESTYLVRVDDGLHDVSPCRWHDHARGAWVERCP